MSIASKRKMVNSAIVAVISAGISLSAAAAKNAPPPMEKCYGIVKAGKNDCGAAGANACAGQSKQNNDPEAWIFVPKGTCNKIAGGNTQPPKTANTGNAGQQ